MTTDVIYLIICLSLLALHLALLIVSACKQKKVLWFLHFALEVLSFGGVFAAMEIFEYMSANGNLNFGEALGVVILSIFALIAFGIIFAASLITVLVIRLVKRSKSKQTTNETT